MRGVWAKESRSVLRMDHTVVTIEIMQSCRDTNKNEIPEYTLQYSQHFLQSITSSNVLAVLVCVCEDECSEEGMAHIRWNWISLVLPCLRFSSKYCKLILRMKNAIHRLAQVDSLGDVSVINLAKSDFQSFEAVCSDNALGTLSSE